MLLVVDDEAWILLMLERGLRKAGFDVVKACDGAEAMTKFDLEPDRFKLVITDIRLGIGPDGWAVGRHVRKRTKIPIVYMSGDSAHEWQSKGVSGSAMLSKPFLTARLREAVMTLLARAGALGAAAD